MIQKYVTDISNGRITTSAFLGRTWKYSTDEEMIKVILELIKKNYAFVHQPAGWPPASVLGDLQEKGTLKHEFTAITWTGDGHKIFQVRPK